MKVLSSILFIIFLGSQASAFKVPVGIYSYSNTQVMRTKHVHRLYQRSSKEKDMIDAYRADGYNCKKHNASVTDCSKQIELNPNNITFKTDRLEEMSPIFSERIEGVKEVSRGELVAVFQVHQENSLASQTNLNYKAYDITDRAAYVDLNLNEHTKVRFRVESPEVLASYSSETETLNKREAYHHSLLSFYTK